MAQFVHFRCDVGGSNPRPVRGRLTLSGVPDLEGNIDTPSQLLHTCQLLGTVPLKHAHLFQAAFREHFGRHTTVYLSDAGDEVQLLVSPALTPAELHQWTELAALVCQGVGCSCCCARQAVSECRVAA